MTCLRSAITISTLLGACVFAQPPGPPPPPPGRGGFGDLRIMGAMNFEGKVVTEAPYTAQAVTETTQTLADGNVIDRKVTSTVARDSHGRTRREETLSNIGPWSTGGQAHTMVFIHDPVAQTNYVLDASRHTANKMPAHARSAGPPPGSPDNGPRIRSSASQANMKKESLGTQTIAGVQAEGTRVTHSIPAGQIGNAKQVDIVMETWYSQDLQMVVMSKHSDPRNGVTTYTLTNIQRAEPDAALFAVPADYTVQQGQGPGNGFNRARHQ